MERTMRRLTLTVALAAATLTLTVPGIAHADSRHHGRLRLCVAEGAGSIALEGDHLSRVTPTLNNGCTPVLWAPTGMYTATIGRYLDAPCYRTVNGQLQNPPQRVTNGARCPASVHAVAVDHGRGPRIVVRGDSVDFRVGRHRTTTVTFRVTDVRYPDCIAGAGAPGATEHVCAPTGPTT
jgi:hypothetical protein